MAFFEQGTHCASAHCVDMNRIERNVDGMCSKDREIIGQGVGNRVARLAVLHLQPCRIF